MKLALLSPGWTLPVMMIARLTAMSSGLELKLVIIAISQSFMANVLQTMVFLIRSFDSGVHRFASNSQQSE